MRVTATTASGEVSRSPSYYRARYYNPATGRFLSEDPIGLSAGINVYAYVADDPLDLLDPTGLSPCVDIGKLTQWLDAHATSHYIKGKNGHCARNVRMGFEAGGLDTSGRPDYAKNYGQFLQDSDFSEVPDSGYQPQAGDTVVFQNYPGGSDAGHIQGWDGFRTSFRV